MVISFSFLFFTLFLEWSPQPISVMQNGFENEKVRATGRMFKREMTGEKR